MVPKEVLPFKDQFNNSREQPIIKEINLLDDYISEEIIKENNNVVKTPIEKKSEEFFPIVYNSTSPLIKDKEVRSDIGSTPFFNNIIPLGKPMK